MVVDRFIESWGAKEGSWAIANPSYLKVIENNSKDIKGFVDFGAGIGTVSAFVKCLRPELLVIGVEPDSWCRSAFEVNTVDCGNLVLTDSLRKTDVSSLVGFSWSIDMAF